MFLLMEIKTEHLISKSFMLLQPKSIKKEFHDQSNNFALISIITLFAKVGREMDKDFKYEIELVMGTRKIQAFV